MFQKIRDISTLLKAEGQYETLRKEIDGTPTMKSLFASKTFWFNALTLALTVSNILPAKYSLVVASVANIGLRIVSNQPVSIPTPWK